jgi:hypothetical protein
LFVSMGVMSSSSMFLLYPWSTGFFIKAMADLLSTLSNGVLGAEPCTSASTRASHNA